MTAVVGLAVAGFLVLHGVVHLWYVVLSQGWVEMEDAMGWNGRSWLLSNLLTEGTVLSLASVRYVLVAVGFLAGGVGYALGRDWATPVLVGAAALSTVVIVAMLDGRFDLPVEKGVVGVAINVAVVALLVLRRVERGRPDPSRSCKSVRVPTYRSVRVVSPVLPRASVSVRTPEGRSR
jgi:hypothetical protein